MNQDINNLIKLSRKAREKAYAPFSNFKVGAIVVSQDGKFFTGCNIENASYGLTVCAERVAIWKAISDGERDFSYLCVVADTDELTPPCGACRQIIWEFCGDVTIIFANLKGKHEIIQMKYLLPRAFDAKFIT